MSSFKTWVFVTIITSKAVESRCLDLQFGFDILAPVWLHFKILGAFLFKLLVTLFLTTEGLECRPSIRVRYFDNWLQFRLHFQILGEFLFNFLVTLTEGLGCGQHTKVGFKTAFGQTFQSLG